MVDQKQKNRIIDGVVFSEDGETLIKMPIEAQKSTYIVPDGVKRIASNAFENCRDITAIILPDDLIYIDNEAFKNCSSIYSIKLPSNLYGLGYDLFSGCDNLSTLIISGDIYGFMAEWELILNNLTHKCSIYIDDYYYSQGYDNTPLVMFTIFPLSDLKQSIIVDETIIPEGTTVIDSEALMGREDIGHVACPNSLVCIKKRAFANCEELSSISLPSSLQEIDDYAFEGCKKLSNISLPEGIKRIGTGAFQHTSISDIFIPSSIEVIEIGAFRECDCLTTISVSPNNPYYSSHEGILYNKDMTKLILVPCQNSISYYRIPDSVLSVSDDAFKNCVNIKQLSINNTINNLSISILTNDLTNLEIVNINSKCESFNLIDGVIFSEDGKELIKMSNNSQIGDYIIPSTVEKVHSKAFYKCDQLKSLTIPASTKVIGSDIIYGCNNLSSLMIYGNLTRIYKSTLSGINCHCKIYVPDEAFIDNYERTPLRYFDVYSLKEIEDNNGADREKIFNVDLNEQFYAKALRKRSKLIGTVSLETIEMISRRIYEFLDVSEAEFGFGEEKWSTCFGISHHGPVYGNSGVREVDILLRLLSQVRATTILLPDDVMRRHINTAKKNKHIKQLIVRDTCKLFAYENGKLMNKKKTIVVFETTV